MRGGRQKGNGIRRIPAVSLEIVLDDPDMVKTELIGLAEQPETLIKIDVGRLFFRPDIREKVNPDFHRGLSITEVDKAAAPNDNTKL